MSKPHVLSPEEAIGAVTYYNPAPKIPGMTPAEFGGRKYPYNTRAMQCSNGRWWVAEPEGFLKFRDSEAIGIPWNDPDRNVIVDAVNHKLVPWGLVRVDWLKAAEVGEALYFQNLAADGINALIVKIDEMKESLARENEGRLRVNLMQRPPSTPEQLLFDLADAMRKRLSMRGALKVEEQRKAIARSAEAPDPVVSLDSLSVAALRKQVTAMIKRAGVPNAPALFTKSRAEILEYVKSLKAQGVISSDTDVETKRDAEEEVEAA